MILIIGFLFLIAVLLGIVAFHIFTWCLNRRLTGIIVYPGDHTWSVDFFDASWRDDGVRFLVLFGGTFAGTAAALLPRRNKGGNSSITQIEEKM